MSLIKNPVRVLPNFMNDHNQQLRLKIDAAKSPCLIPENNGKACKHHGCFMTHVHPKYHSDTVKMFFDARQEFTHFRKSESNCIPGTSFVMAVNPYDNTNDAERSRFEFFRQAWPFVASGQWPRDRELFHRSEVQIVFEEYNSGCEKDVREVMRFKH